MGYAISWIAFEDKTGAQAAQMLGLSCSGKFHEVPNGRFSGAPFPKPGAHPRRAVLALILKNDKEFC